MKRLLLGLALSALFTSAAVAADDPSIKGQIRTDIQEAMKRHIGRNTLGDHYVIYDAIKGELKKLTFKELHKGIVKKGDFYVSCADFVDASGTKYDLDFLVSARDDVHVLQALVNSINGEKHKYHLENPAQQ